MCSECRPREETEGQVWTKFEREKACHWEKIFLGNSLFAILCISSSQMLATGRVICVPCGTCPSLFFLDYQTKHLY